jgi:hypothetical protein
MASPLKDVAARRRTVLAHLLALPLSLASTRWARAQTGEVSSDGSEDPMATVGARYAALASYRDSGTVETTYQWPGTPALTERHRFETAFRAPRNFFFRFDQDAAAGGDAFVIWCDGGPFQSWWKSTGSHEVYDGGRGATAFLTGEYPTRGAATLVAPHLFPQAELYGVSTRLIDPFAGDVEQLDGRAVRSIRAERRETGVQTEEHRPLTVWIDESSGLIVRLRLDEAEGSAEGLVDNIEYKVEPVADPLLDDALFFFTPTE